MPTWVVSLVRIRSGLVVHFGPWRLARCLAMSLVWSKPRERMWRSMVGRGTTTDGVSVGGRISYMSSASGRASERIERYL